MRTASRLALIVAVALAALASDQAAKHLARIHLRGAGTVGVVGKMVVLTYAENDGAFLSLGHAWPRSLKVAVFSGLSSLVVAAAGVWAARSARLSAPRTFALSLIIGGGLGNLVDRLTRNGYVTDFVNVGIGALRSGVFNLADLYLFAGMILFVLGQRKEGLMK